MLKGKTVVLGVTGGIAAYKAASLASMLMKQHELKACYELILRRNFKSIYMNFKGAIQQNEGHILGCRAG